jgi:hypothetical protein
MQAIPRLQPEQGSTLGLLPARPAPSPGPAPHQGAHLSPSKYEGLRPRLRRPTAASTLSTRAATPAGRACREVGGHSMRRQVGRRWLGPCASLLPPTAMVQQRQRLAGAAWGQRGLWGQWGRWRSTEGRRREERLLQSKQGWRGRNWRAAAHVGRGGTAPTGLSRSRPQPRLRGPGLQAEHLDTVQASRGCMQAAHVRQNGKEGGTTSRTSGRGTEAVQGSLRAVQQRVKQGALPAFSGGSSGHKGEAHQ